MGTDRSIEESVCQYAPVWAVGYEKARQGTVGRTPPHRRVIRRVIDAAVARTQDQVVAIQLLIDRAAEMRTDGAVRDQTGHAVTGRDAHHLYEVVFIAFLPHREELDRAVDWQVSRFEGLAWLTSGGGVGIREDVADGESPSRT